LALAEDIHIQKMIVASDCLQMINNLHGEYGGSYSMVTQEIKALMSVSDRKPGFKFRSS
jgi:hypothetical protein